MPNLTYKDVLTENSVITLITRLINKSVDARTSLQEEQGFYITPEQRKSWEAQDWETIESALAELRLEYTKEEQVEVLPGSHTSDETLEERILLINRMREVGSSTDLIAKVLTMKIDEVRKYHSLYEAWIGIDID